MQKIGCTFSPAWAAIFCVNLENFARLELIYEGRFFEGDARFGARSYAARFFLIEDRKSVV